ncbi:MAG TPA: LacI family DNA-binding transcriptional regulator [Acidimicrobiia bacterium]|nr:LacI family DNA-binding transcriptional regulator [Acidimicrobiia bacterium]
MGESLRGDAAARKPPTLRDVAERAGVHPATASRALNPALPGRISPETTRKVQEAARVLGYRPDPAARSLRTRRSGVVGVVVPDLMNPVLPPIVRGIEETLWEVGLACLLADTDNRSDREEAFVEEMLGRRCEGLIVATAARDSSAVASLEGLGIPTVLVTREIDHSPFPFVGGDDASGVAAAVEHLVALGHRRIAYVTGPPNLSTTMRREQAFVEALTRHLPEARVVVHHTDGFTVPAGKKGAVDVLTLVEPPTAILAGNDMMALGVYETLDAHGLSCPGDISVVGHNDMPFMSAVRPPLTTVAIPQYDVGVEAARILMSLRAGEPPKATRRLLPTRLVVRGSTAPPS